MPCGAAGPDPVARLTATGGAAPIRGGRREPTWCGTTATAGPRGGGPRRRPLRRRARRHRLAHHVPHRTTPGPSGAQDDLRAPRAWAGTSPSGLPGWAGRPRPPAPRTGAGQPRWRPQDAPLRVSHLQAALAGGPRGSAVGTGRRADGPPADRPAPPGRSGPGRRTSRDGRPRRVGLAARLVDAGPLAGQDRDQVWRFAIDADVGTPRRPGTPGCGSGPTRSRGS